MNAIPGSKPVGKPVPEWIAELASQADLQLSCPPGRETFGSNCVPCRKGHYCIGGQALRCTDGTWHNETGQTTNSSCRLCPSTGSRCLTGDTLEVLPGYFMRTYKDEFAYKCASASACTGGPLTFGEESCSPGHTGMICGGCKPGWYRGRRKCLSCIGLVGAEGATQEQLDATKNGTIAGAASLIALLFLVLLAYLRPPEAAGSCVQACEEALKPTLERYHLDLSAAREHIPALLSGLFKVLLSYSQCLGAISRFSQVRWPLIFIQFMDMLNELLPELLTVLPAECVAGSRLGFEVELYSTLSLPIVGAAFTWVVILFIRFTSLRGRHSGEAGIFVDEYGYDPVRARNLALRRRRVLAKGDEAEFEEDADLEELNSPQDYLDISWIHTVFLSLHHASGHPKVINVYIFMMLWIYPMLCRKSLATFDCVAAGVDSTGAEVKLLRDDPVVFCSTSSWLIPASAAGAGVLLYALGVPFAAWWLAYSHRREVQREEQEEKERLELRLVAKVKRKKWRKGSSLLARIYKDQYWYCEPASLLHNFFFTGVIHIVMPETRVQIWVGVFVSLMTYIAFLLTRPYKYYICTMVQSAALLQVLLTYITAFLFYRDATLADGVQDQSIEHGDAMGVVLVCINCICFLAMTLGTIAGILRQQRHHAEGQLRIQLDGKRAKESGRKQKEMLVFAKHLQGEAVDEHEESKKWHTFLSHVWSSAQDQMRFLKTRLIRLIPDVRVFLDVDDLTEGFGAESVLECSSVLIFVSEGYFESKNCVRELLVAALAKKEMITVLELDVNRWKTLKNVSSRGSSLLDVFKGEIFTKLLLAEERFDEWFSSEKWYYESECPTAQALFEELFRWPPIEWNRLTDFQNETLRLIAVRLLKPKYNLERGFIAFVPGANRGVNLPPPREGYAFHMYCSKYNPTALKLRDEMNYCLKKQAAKMKSRRSQKSTTLLETAVSDTDGETRDNLELIKQSEVFLLHLTSDTWADPERTRKLASDIVDAMRARVRIVLAHEMPSVDDAGRHPVSFDVLFSSDENGISITPRFLKDAGIYSTIATPLKGGDFREISLFLLLGNIASPPRPGLPNPFQNDENLSRSAHSFMSAASSSTMLLRKRIRMVAAMARNQVAAAKNTSSARAFAPPKPPMTTRSSVRLPGARARIMPEAPLTDQPPATGSWSSTRCATLAPLPPIAAAPNLRRRSAALDALGLPLESLSLEQAQGRGGLLKELLGAAVDSNALKTSTAAALPRVHSDRLNFGVPASPRSLKRVWKPPPKVQPYTRSGGLRQLRMAVTSQTPIVEEQRSEGTHTHTSEEHDAQSSADSYAPSLNEATSVARCQDGPACDPGVASMSVSFADKAAKRIAPAPHSSSRQRQTVPSPPLPLPTSHTLFDETLHRAPRLTAPAPMRQAPELPPREAAPVGPPVAPRLRPRTRAALEDERSNTLDKYAGLGDGNH